MATKFAFRIIKNHKVPPYTRTSKKRRFIKMLRSIKFEEDHPLVELKVDYGVGIDVHGKRVRFTNTGEYDNEVDLWQAFKAFEEAN